MLGLTWTGGLDELKAEPETEDIEYIIPEDGTLYWLDVWSILTGAPHPEAAYAFLNFIQEPEIQGKETNINYYATANDEAKKFVDPAILDEPDRVRPGRASSRSSRARPTSRPTRCGSRSGRSSSRASAADGRPGRPR